MATKHYNLTSGSVNQEEYNYSSHNVAVVAKQAMCPEDHLPVVSAIAGQEAGYHCSSIVIRCILDEDLLLHLHFPGDGA